MMRSIPNKKLHRNKPMEFFVFYEINSYPSSLILSTKKRVSLVLALDSTVLLALEFININKCVTIPAERRDNITLSNSPQLN